MKTALLLLSLLTGAMALNPSPLPNKVTKTVGSTAPFPDFDPLNLYTPTREKFYREAELKHGRLGMVAATTFPLVESFTHEPAINEFQKLDDLTDFCVPQICSLVSCLNQKSTCIFMQTFEMLWGGGLVFNGLKT